VVTGIGLITPIGIGAAAFWQALLAGRIATRTVTRFDASDYPSRVAAEVDDFDPTAYMGKKRVRWTDRYAQFSVAAARLAIDDARLSVNGNGNDVSVFVGSALGGLAYADEQYNVFREKGIGAVHPLLAISVFGGASVSNIAMELGLHGQSVANANSCASGLVAIGQAYRAIARGETRAALAGGVEAPLAPLLFGAFTVINAMSRRNDDPSRASRPFDRDRDGFVMGEGGGMFVLERLDDAVSRDARIYGEIAGFGSTNDGYHMSAPAPDGVQVTRAMGDALAEARVVSDEVEAINAHGSSTPLGDRTESVAYERLFGERLRTIPISATKGQHGHALGATGAWETAVALLSMRDGIVPGSVNFERADEGCVPAVRADNVYARSRITLANSSGFGGINAALVLKTVS